MLINASIAFSENVSRTEDVSKPEFKCREENTQLHIKIKIVLYC